VSAAREKILGEVNQERVRQDARWGEQNHPDVDRVLTGRPTGCRVERMAMEYNIPSANSAREACDGAARIGQCTWAHILVEEIAEAVEAATLAQLGQGTLAALRKELVQVAAVAVSWIEAIDRRGE
jgi:hypothetical protein